MRNYQSLNKAGREDTKLIPVLWRTSAAVRRGAQKNQGLVAIFLAKKLQFYFIRADLAACAIVNLQD
jgi:hypothetical protein